jgi:catechol 2,3-dioxygenase-like lactoylglutathione lyase family enzyme/diadenosine tetraphosphate (Ap4A) HIT family hydrolase
MNAGNAPTAIHARVEACRAGLDPTLVARLASGWVVMGERQVLRGYCLLLPDPVVAHLNDMPPAGQAAFLADVARVGQAVLELTGAVRINYAIFGNIEPALHAHVIPRFADEPAALKTTHPWTYDWSQARRYDAAVDGALQWQLHERLGGATAARTSSSTRAGRIHHIDLTVSSLERSTPFYDDVLTRAGYVRVADADEGPLWRGDGQEIGLQGADAEGLARPPHHRFAPGLHHLALTAPSRAAVDAYHRQLVALGVTILDPPAQYDRYLPGYYAVFFADPDGLKLEYVYTPVTACIP